MNGRTAHGLIAIVVTDTAGAAAAGITLHLAEVERPHARRWPAASFVPCEMEILGITRHSSQRKIGA